jgi:DNA-directed RNA polymerase specialized sigma24 family protein
VSAACRPPATYTHTAEAWSRAQRSAGRSFRAKNLAVFCVDGEYVTLEQMGERLGITTSTVRRRLNRERKSDGPVSWAGLAVPEMSA